MLKAKSFLTVDCGANTLKLAEFEPTQAGGLRLRQYAFQSLGLEGAQETTRATAMVRALETLLSQGSYKARDISVCAPGFHVFSKFVKLPPVDGAKVAEIIRFEAQQNVPFPLEEVVWDYQVVGTTPGGEIEVLLVAIKNDVVEGLYSTMESAGLRMKLCDVSPAALTNAFRYNYGDLDGCTMLLDIGAKTSNLIFFEKGKVFSRSINIGANSITQDFANDSKMSFEQAERVKTEKGFVSLGGAYEDPEDPEAAAISKISRQVMTRLHIQVNQTIQFYKSQQGGGAPQRLFLSGGASIMGYTAQFFAEKLGLPVDYFNPLRNVELDPGLNIEELSKVAHSLGEVVGLGLRNVANCPVDLNLMPESSLRQQEFRQKMPFLVATAYSLVLVAFSYVGLENKLIEAKKKEAELLAARIEPLRNNKTIIQSETKSLTDAMADAQRAVALVETRQFWPDMFGSLRTALINTEDAAKISLGTDVGLWVDKIATVIPGGEVSAPMKNQGRRPNRPTGPAVTYDTYGNATRLSVLISNVVLTVRGVDMTAQKAEANSTIVYDLEAQLKAMGSLFDTNQTKLQGQIRVETNTFVTDLLLAPKRPLPLH